MRYFFVIGSFVVMILSACEFSIKQPKEENRGTKIRNGITIKQNGIKVEQAFLLFEDGNLVPKENKVKLNQTVKLRLITSGWKEKNGRVFISGTEIVETSEGDVLLNEKDLFKNYKEGLSIEDAKYITLDVVITRIDKLYDYFRVSFQLKDQTEPQNAVEGYYKLYIE